MIFHRYFLGLSNKPFANESEAPKAQDKETDPQFPVSAFLRSWPTRGKQTVPRLGIDGRHLAHHIGWRLDKHKFTRTCAV